MRRTVPPSAEIQASIDKLLAKGMVDDPQTMLSELARLGAKLIIQRAVEEEFDEWLGRARYERRRGMLKMFSLPLSLGVDGAGVVIAAGDRSTARVGDRVAWEGVPGSYAEVVAAPSERHIPIPGSVSFEAAAGGPMQGMTAQRLCYEAVPVVTDAVVLVHPRGAESAAC